MVLWYYLGGSNANKLSIYTRETIEGDMQLQWRQFDDGSSLSWKVAVVAFNQAEIFQVRHFIISLQFYLFVVCYVMLSYTPNILWI